MPSPSHGHWLWRGLLFNSFEGTRICCKQLNKARRGTPPAQKCRHTLEPAASSTGEASTDLPAWGACHADRPRYCLPPHDHRRGLRSGHAWFVSSTQYRGLLQMSAKHTPGPWKLSLGSEYVINGGNGQNVFLIGNDRRAIPSTDDARLILAAPDLLAELIKITDAYAQAMKNAGVTHYPEALVEVKQARAAIAKATGSAK